MLYYLEFLKYASNCKYKRLGEKQQVTPLVSVVTYMPRKDNGHTLNHKRLNFRALRVGVMPKAERPVSYPTRRMIRNLSPCSSATYDEFHLISIELAQRLRG